MKVRTSGRRVLIRRRERARSWPMCGCRFRLALSVCLYLGLMAQLTVGVSSVSTLTIQSRQTLAPYSGGATA